MQRLSFAGALLVLFVATSPAALADAPFEPEELIDEYIQPPVDRTVRMADIDGDGDLDVIEGWERRVYWYENVDGCGDFGPRRYIEDGWTVTDIAFANLDGDPGGTLEVIVSGGTTIRIYRQVDLEADDWETLATLATGDSVHSLEVGNFDADLLPDIFYLMFGALGRAFNNGDDTFTTSELAPGGNDFKVLQLDEDPLPDIFIAQNGGFAVDYNGKGFTTFLFEDTNFLKVECGDIDKDEDIDLVVVYEECEKKPEEGVEAEVPGFCETSIATMENDGGVLLDPVFLDFVPGITDCTLADIDCDGCLDLVVTEGVTKFVFFAPLRWYRGGPDGSFGEPEAIEVECTNVRGVAAGDLDGDEDCDLAISAYEEFVGKLEAGDGKEMPGLLKCLENTTKSLVAPNPGGRQGGSMLVIPVQRSSNPLAGPPGAAAFFTVVSITNTATTPALFGNPGGTTDVLFEYVNALPNPMNPLRPLDCYIVDRGETLTPADTLSVLTGCHNAATAEGYLVVTATDPFAFKQPWSHNSLVGSALVVNSSGGAYSINAVSFQSLAAPGDPADFAPANGLADLNGVEYTAAPERLILDSFIAGAQSHLSLMNLTGPVSAVNTVKMDLWNDNEFPFSATFSFNCWFDQPLTNVSPVFEASFLASLPNDPGELDLNCDGTADLETGWGFVDSIGVSSPIGSFGDGVLLGAITAGTPNFTGARLPWEEGEQTNGQLILLQ